jgi:ATP-binding cassette, subfamily B, heavy metal transporter
MRHHAAPSPALPVTAPAQAPVSDWATLKRLFPYLWEYKWRVVAALSFMVGAKLANVGVPLLLKELIDALTPQPSGAQMLMVCSAGFVVWLWFVAFVCVSIHRIA